MALLNMWSLGHFAQWGIVGYVSKIGWIPFFVLSIGWEVLYIMDKEEVNDIDNLEDWEKSEKRF